MSLPSASVSSTAIAVTEDGVAWLKRNLPAPGSAIAVVVSNPNGKPGSPAAPRDPRIPPPCRMKCPVPSEV